MAKTDWKEEDVVRPEDMNTVGAEINANTAKLSESTSAATASTIMQRGVDGQAHVGAPTAATHIARKQDVDAVSSASVPKERYVNGGADLNNVVESGFYRLAGSGYVNAPNGVDYGQLIVSRGGGDTIMQIATGYNNNQLFWRQGNPTQIGGGGSWGAWNSIAHKQDVVAAMNRADEAFQSASNGKNAVATAITGMGQAASGSDSFAQLASKISAISNDATASAGEVLTGKTFYQGGSKKTGTMPDKRNTFVENPWSNSNADTGVDTYPPAGYYDGATAGVFIRDHDLVPANIKSGVEIFGVTGNFTNDAVLDPAWLTEGYSGYDDGVLKKGTLSKRPNFSAVQSLVIQNGRIYIRLHHGAYKESTSTGYPEVYYDDAWIVWTGDVTTDDGAMLSGYTYWSHGVKRTGTMPNRSSQNDHMPSTNYTVWQGDRVFLQPPNGYYNGSSWVTAPAGDFKAENILEGKNILGVWGTQKPYRYARGTSPGNDAFCRSGNIGFKPKFILILRYGTDSPFARPVQVWYSEEMSSTEYSHWVDSGKYEPRKINDYPGNVINSSGFTLYTANHAISFEWIAIG